LSIGFGVHFGEGWDSYPTICPGFLGERLSAVQKNSKSMIKFKKFKYLSCNITQSKSIITDLKLISKLLKNKNYLSKDKKIGALNLGCIGKSGFLI